MNMQALPSKRPTAATLRWNAGMKWIRRLHLYAGLLLFPWIILYGITACLFNHPDWLSDRTPSEKSQVPNLPKAETLAEELVNSINKAKTDSQSTPTVKLIHSDESLFSRRLVAVATTQDGQTLNVVVDMASGDAEIRQRTARPAANVPAFAKDKQKLASDPLEKIKSQVSQLLKDKGHDAKDVQIQAVPDLDFQAEVNGELWEMKYNMQRGTFTAKKNDSPSSLTVRNFLLRLHLAHGYPNEQNIRFYWAIVVDVMFVAMVFWGISGVFMWWQLKAQRRIGLVLLLISAGLATWLTWGMHTLFSK
jgi:hypothetical protein